MRFRGLAAKNNQRLANAGDSQPTAVGSIDPTSLSEVPMKLIPWEDIWTSLSVARIRGNSDMIDVFYDTLFREAIFDDDGAWSLNRKKSY
jgi:hypothetical protein